MPTHVSTGHITIADVNDGLNARLSRDSFTVPTYADGTGGNFTGCSTTISILMGAQDVSNLWSVSASASTGVTGSLSGKTYTVTGLTTEVGSVEFVASLTGFPSLSAVFTVAKARAGSSPVVAVLSNEAHTFPASSAGEVSSYAGSGTLIYVYEGSAALTYDGTGTSNGTWGVTAAVSNITCGTLTDSGTYLTVGDHSGVAAATDTSSITYTITGKTASGTSFSFTKVQSFTKSKSGVAGVGQDATAYWLVSSSPAIQKSAAGAYTPGSVSYSIRKAVGSATPTAYAGRFIIYTSSDGSAYTAKYTSAADESSTSYTVPAATKSIKVQAYLAGGTSTLLDEHVSTVVSDGTNGTRTAVLEMFQWSASAPTTFPSGTSTYTWATGSFTAPATPGSWTLTPGSAVAGQTLYIVRQAYADTQTAATSTVTWSATSASPAGAAGTNGSNGTSPVSAYLSNEAHSFPASSAGAVSSYTGSGTRAYVYEGTTELTYDGTGTSNGTWKVTTSASNITCGTLTDSGTYLTVGDHSGVATATDTSSITYTITGKTSAGTSFSFTKVQSFTKSKAGTTGARSSVIGLYVWGWTSPSVPAGTTTYTWSTGEVSHASETNGWSTTIPSDTNPGKALYYTEKAVVDSTGTATSTAVTWTGAAIRSLSSNAGKSYKCYSKFTGTGATPSGTTALSVGSYPAATGFTGATFLAAFTESPPSLSAGETLWISDGYSKGDGNVTWNTPYLSSFKVGTLSALSADMGSITAGTITFGTSGHIMGGQTAFATGEGIFLGYSAAGTYDGVVYAAAAHRFSIGKPSSQMKWDGSALSLKGAVIACGTGGSIKSASTTPGVSVVGTGISLADANAASPLADAVGNRTRFHVASNGQTHINDLAVWGHTFGLTGGFKASVSSPVFLVQNTYTNSGASAFKGIVAGTGNYAFYSDQDAYFGGTVYTFTGGHAALMAKGQDPVPGDIVSDLEVISREGMSSTLTRIGLSSTPNSPAVGAFVQLWAYPDRRPEDIPEDAWELLKTSDDYVVFNAVGEGLVNVCGEGGDLRPGDLITTSSTPGKGMKQSDDIVRSSTVAKSREHVQFTNQGEVKKIACIYLCG